MPIPKANQQLVPDENVETNPQHQPYKLLVAAAKTVAIGHQKRVRDEETVGLSHQTAVQRKETVDVGRRELLRRHDRSAFLLPLSRSVTGEARFQLLRAFFIDPLRWLFKPNLTQRQEVEILLIPYAVSFPPEAAGPARTENQQAASRQVELGAAGA